MTLLISAAQLAVIYAHAENVYPEEACGILIGIMNNQVKTVVEVLPTINVWKRTELGDNPKTANVKQSIIATRSILKIFFKLKKEHETFSSILSAFFILILIILPFLLIAIDPKHGRYIHTRSYLYFRAKLGILKVGY
jgi:Prokaryotic homologs of the JAB domain